MLLTLLIANALLCFAYISYVKIKHPEITSISESYYKNEPFMWWCFIIGFTLLPIWLEISVEYFQFLAFLSCAFFIFLGTFPRFKEDQTFPHALCAGGLTLLGMIWVKLVGLWPILLIMIPIVILEWLENLDLYWIELTGFVCLYVGLFLALL